ncbi:MAG: hypothetical protein Q9170_004392 [Blastenia crenularia]
MALPLPALTRMAPDLSVTEKSQTLKVPTVSISALDSDISDDDSVLRYDSDSITSDLESDQEAVEKPTQTASQSAIAQQGEPSTTDEDTEVAYDGKKPPHARSVTEIAEDIVDVLARYRLVHKSQTNQPWVARSRFLHQVERFVALQEPVLLSLPAFPFKSPNKATKVLGTLPDKGEEVALLHLQGLCLAIKDVYAHGADVFIVSDGVIYNDIMGISDAEVWQYSQALQRMARDCGCNHVKFLPLRNLLGGEDVKEPTTEADYLKDIPYIRERIIERYLPSGFDIETHLAKDTDATMTYRGYLKFLKIDLATQNGEKTSKLQIKKTHEGIAKNMMARGKAFAASVAQNLPEYVRLSIHASTEVTKLSMSIIPQLGGHISTPWHSSLVRAVNGSITMTHAAQVSPKTHELIFTNDGHPSYFRERSPLFSWQGMDLEFSYIYPTGIIITPRDLMSKYSLRDVDMQKVRALSEACSPVILRGFTDTTDVQTFESKAHDAGTVAPWTFGIRQAVKDAGNDDPKASTVTSTEAMPMHYDGMFFFKKELDPATGVEKLVSQVPRFQYFTSIAPAPPGDGMTLFASSQLFFQHLPAPYTLSDLQDLKWECKHSSNWSNHMDSLPLVVPHPTNQKPCLRWHEPWYKWQTKFSHNEIRIENAEQHYKEMITQMLYDRRVCLYFGFEKGDVLVADNVSMMHTRTAFTPGTGRELWRIHFN